MNMCDGSLSEPGSVAGPQKIASIIRTRSFCRDFWSGLIGHPATFGQFRSDLAGQSKMNMPLAFTIPEAVKVSGLSRSAIYEAMKRGDLRARKAGRRTLISTGDLQAFLDGLPAFRAEEGQ